MQVGSLVRLNTEIYVDELNRMGVVVVIRGSGRFQVHWTNCDFGGAIYRRDQLEVLCE